MYLLVRDLCTEQQAPALVCGVIFAFCRFRFAHLQHLQLLTCQWIPFVFLFLNRFLKRGAYRDLWLFTLFSYYYRPWPAATALFTASLSPCSSGITSIPSGIFSAGTFAVSFPVISGLVIFVCAGPLLSSLPSSQAHLRALAQRRELDRVLGGPDQLSLCRRR